MDKRTEVGLRKFRESVQRRVELFDTSTKRPFRQDRITATGWIAGIMYVRAMEEDTDG